MGFINEKISLFVIGVSSLLIVVFQLILRIIFGRKRKLFMLIRQPDFDSIDEDYREHLIEDGKYMERIFRLRGYSFMDVRLKDMSVEEFRRLIAEQLNTVEEIISIGYMGYCWIEPHVHVDENTKEEIVRSPHNRGILFKNGERLSDAEFFEMIGEYKTNEDLVVNITTLAAHSQTNVLYYSPDVETDLKNVLTLSLAQKRNTRFILAIFRIVYSHELDYREFYEIVETFKVEAAFLARIRAAPRRLIYKDFVT